MSLKNEYIRNKFGQFLSPFHTCTELAGINPIQPECKCFKIQSTVGREFQRVEDLLNNFDGIMQDIRDDPKNRRKYLEGCRRVVISFEIQFQFKGIY